jgi:hypothetical protein
MRPAPVLLLLALALPVRAADGALERCLNLAGQRENVALAKDCPALWRELQKEGLAASFEPPLNEKATAAQLHFLLRSRQAVRAPGAIGADGLEQLLAGILQPETPNPEAEWWKTLMAWLDKLKSGNYETQYRWLAELFGAITPSRDFVLAFLYGTIALLVILSAWFVVRELYYAGVFAKLPGLRPKPAYKNAIVGQRHKPSISLQDLSALPPRRQIAALLNNAVAGLSERGVVPDDATLTHRQLARCITRQAPQIEAAFALLLRHAEPVLFGNRGVSDDTLRICRRQAQLLLGTQSA